MRVHGKWNISFNKEMFDLLLGFEWCIIFKMEPCIASGPFISLFTLAFAWKAGHGLVATLQVCHWATVHLTEQIRTEMSTKSQTEVEEHTFLLHSHDFLMTFSWLSYVFLVTFLWFSPDFLITFSSLSQDFIMTFLWFSHDFLMIFSWFLITFS